MNYRKMLEFAKKNHLVIFLSLLCLFLLLWNLDRYVHICPWGTIPLWIGVIMEILLHIEIRKRQK